MKRISEEKLSLSTQTVLRISPKKNEYGYIHMILHATCRADGVVIFLKGKEIDFFPT